MTRTPSPRFGIFVCDGDGDTGDGRIIGPYRDQAAAWDKLDAMHRAADRRGVNIMAVVVPILPSSAGVKSTLDAVATS